MSGITANNPYLSEREEEAYLESLKYYDEEGNMITGSIEENETSITGSVEK